ncbi:MAG: hypothetical protein ACFFDY_05375 [Candidatus Thorarchaeota archaeon]
MVNIRLCPKCKKPTLKTATNVSGGIAPNLYECKDIKCGYIGSFYIEVDSEDYQLDQEEDQRE